MGNFVLVSTAAGSVALDRSSSLLDRLVEWKQINVAEGGQSTTANQICTVEQDGA